MSFAVFALAEEGSISNKNIFQDIDQDGLSDAEESVYGTDPRNPDTDSDSYSDGVEVKGGYDPLKPAPNDKIIPKINPQVLSDANEKRSENSVNLTEEINQKAVALLEEKTKENKEIEITDINALIEESLESKITFDDLPIIDLSAIKIKRQNYEKLGETERLAKEKKDTLEYIAAVAYIFAVNSPQEISVFEDLENLMDKITGQVMIFTSSGFSDTSYFKNLADKGEQITEQLKEIEVPQNMLELHVQGMQIAEYALILRKVSFDQNDPYASIINLSKAANFIELMQNFSENLNSHLTKMGISEIPVSF